MVWAWDLPKSQCLKKQQNSTDMSIENYIILLREIKTNLKHGVIYVVDMLDDSNCYSIHSIQYQSQSLNLTEADKPILKSIWEYKEPTTAKIILK